MISTNTPFAKLRASLKRSIFGRCHVTRSSRLDKPFNHGGKMHGAKESFLCQERCLKQTSAISIPSTPYLRAYDTYYTYFITPIHALLSNSHSEFTEALLQFIFKVYTPNMSLWIQCLRGLPRHHNTQYSEISSWRFKDQFLVKRS